MPSTSINFLLILGVVRSISLSVPPKGVNKAFALDYLLKVMNRDKKGLIAFGDEHNDTEMLAFAGKGYAMKMLTQSYSLMQMSKFP